MTVSNGSQSEMRRHIEDARHRRRPHEDPVARHELKPSCRLVVSNTSRHAVCKTHTAQFCGPLLSAPLSVSDSWVRVGPGTLQDCTYGSNEHILLQRRYLWHSVGRRREQIVKGVDIHPLRERLRLGEHPRLLDGVILPEISALTV